MNKKTLLRQLRIVQELLYRLLVKRLGTKACSLPKHNYYINIADNDIEVFDHIHKQVRQGTNNSGMGDIMFLVFEDEIHVDMKHFSPLLQSSYFNSNKKYKAHYPKRAMPRGSFHMYSRSCNSPSMSGSYKPANSFLRHSSTTSLQHTSVRMFGTNMSYGTAYMDSKQHHFSFQHLILSITNNEENNLRSYSYFSNNMKSTCDKSGFTIAKLFFNNDHMVPSLYSPTTPSGGNNMNVTNYILYREPKMTSYLQVKHYHHKRDNCREKMLTLRKKRDVHTAMKEKDSSSNSPANPFLKETETKDISLLEKQKNAELLVTAERLLNELKRVINTENEVSGQIDDTKSDTNEFKNVLLNKYNNLDNRFVITKLLSGKYGMIADYYNKKTKPLSIDSKIWINYTQGQSNILDKLLATQPNISLPEKMEVYSSKWENDKINKDVIKDVNNYRLVPQNSKSFFVGFLGSIKKFCDSIISGFQDVSGNKQHNNETRGYKLFLRRIIKKSTKDQRTYDFRIKPVCKSCSSQSDAIIGSAERTKFPSAVENSKVTDIIDFCKKRRTFKVIRPSENKEITNYENSNFYKQFKKHGGKTELYSNVERNEEIGEKSPQVLLRFCYVLKSMIIRMNELNDAKEGSQLNDRWSENKVFVLQNTDNKRCNLQHSSANEADFPVNISNLCGANEFKLYSANLDFNDDTVSTDKYLDVRIQSDDNKDMLTDVEIDDVEIEVCENDNYSLKDFGINRNSAIINKSLGSPLQNTAPNCKKFVTVNLKLNIPYSQKNKRRGGQ